MKEEFKEVTQHEVEIQSLVGKIKYQIDEMLEKENMSNVKIKINYDKAKNISKINLALSSEKYIAEVNSELNTYIKKY